MDKEDIILLPVDSGLSVEVPIFFGMETVSIILNMPIVAIYNCLCKGRRREPGQRHGCGGSVLVVAGGRRPLEGSYSRPGARAGTVCGWACRGLGNAVRSCGAGLSVRERLG